MSVSERLDACARVLTRHNEALTECNDMFKQVHQLVRDLRDTIRLLHERVEALERKAPPEDAPANPLNVAWEKHQAGLVRPIDVTADEREEIEAIQKQTGVTYDVALTALKKHGGNIVDAILELSPE